MFPFVPTELAEDEEKKHSFPGQRKLVEAHPHPPLLGWPFSSYAPLKISRLKRGQRLLSGLWQGVVKKYGKISSVCFGDDCVLRMNARNLR
jgi:hypothetical protein